MEAALSPCPHCGYANRPGRRFCGGCGRPLAAICPSCGTENPGGARFCDECGSPLVGDAGGVSASHPDAATLSPALVGPPPEPRPVAPPTAAPPEEERRLVTALFCDLVGFTPLSESLDPEEVRDIQADYFNVMSRQIERYGGIVEKYAGDAVLALFGARIAHEDDAERAVLCALGMQSAIEPVARKAQTRWQVEPQIRVGVNTGEVVSGTWDASGRQDVAVTGDALNTAARFQAAAEPGEVLVGTETMRLTRRRIRYGPTRDLILKGKQGTVPAYTALGIREDFGERWEEAPRISPLVGRDRELLMLLDAWLRAQGGEGQLLTVVGEPGVGKSRLVAEALERIAEGSPVRLIRARCLSYGQEISLWLLADLLRSLCGIREQDTQGDVRVKLDTALQSLLADANATSQQEARDVLGEVLGLSPGESMVAHAGPQIRRQALLRSLRLLLGALSQRVPAILVLEDLHWVDTASEEVLKEILADVPGLRLLVLVSQRPGWNAPWSEWGWTERLTLRPLREGDAAVLAGAVLGGISLSDELERYVAERAGGNPFFVEEMLRALQETGGLETRDGVMHLAPGAAELLPSTLTEILLARLDRLESQVKRVAQVGSVIGRSFAVRLLAQVMEREQTTLELPLSALQQAEIAFPRRGIDLEYVFKHVSMREVAYNTLVQRRRRELHLQTARAIAALYPADEYVEMVAYHYARTEEHGEATEWLERAGDRAASVYSTESALAHYRDTLRRLEEMEGDARAAARVEEKLGNTLYTAGRYDEALEVLGQAMEGYRAQRDLEAAAQVTARMGMAHRFRGTPDEGIALVQPVLDLLAWSGPSPALAALHIAMASLYSLAGRYHEMQEAAERAEEIARAIGDERLLGEAEERRGTAFLFLGESIEQALQTFEGAIPLIQAGGDLMAQFRVLNNAGFCCEQLGRMEADRRYLEQALGVVERMGNAAEIAFVLASLGSALTILGEWGDAQKALDRGLAVLGDEQAATRCAPLTMLGQLTLYQGKWEDAERLLTDGVAEARRTDEEQIQEIAQAALGELEVLSGRAHAAISRLAEVGSDDDVVPDVLAALAWAYLDDGEIDRAEEVAEGVERRTRAEGQRLYLLRALRVTGMIRLRQGRWDDAEAAFNEALDFTRSLPFPYEEGRVLHQLSLLEQLRGEQIRAQQHLKDALTIFRRLGAGKDAESTEQALAAATSSPEESATL